jgi:hypothetical protein
MPATRIGTRAGGPGWTVETYTTGRSTPVPTLVLAAAARADVQGGPGPTRPGAGDGGLHPSSSKPNSGLPAIPWRRCDTPRADPPGHTRAVRRRGDQYRTAAPPHSLLVSTSRAEV